MREMFPDWRAQGMTSPARAQGGFAFNVDSMHGIADKARAGASGSSTAWR